jgi:hypothetical protein
VSKAILFKKTDGIIKKMDFGPFKIYLVLYTIALLSKLTNKRIDLEKIWNEQDISPALQMFIGQLASAIRIKITYGPSGSRNISEYCKTKDCWASVQNIKIDVPESLESELISEESVKKRDEKFGEQGETIPLECLLEEEFLSETDENQDTGQEDNMSETVTCTEYPQTSKILKISLTSNFS